MSNHSFYIDKITNSIEVAATGSFTCFFYNFFLVINIPWARNENLKVQIKIHRATLYTIYFIKLLYKLFMDKD